MHNEMDTSKLLGFDALTGIVRSTWQQVVTAAVQYGPNLLIALLLALLYSAVFWLLGRALLGGLRRVVSADAQPLARRILHTVLRLTLLMLVLESVSALFPPLNKYGPAIFRGYLLLLLLYVGWGGLERLIHLQTRRWSLDASLELLLRNGLRTVWVLIGLYLVFGQFGVNLLPILGGLGVAGIALGFAAQDILANLISGVTLLLDRPFRIGDWIRVNDHEGQVTGLTLRTTRIRTRDNEFVSIPNKEVAGDVVVNLTQGGPLRLNIPIGIAYKENVEEARTALLALLTTHPKIMQERPPLVLVKALSASSVDLIMRFWVSEADIAGYPVIGMQVSEQAKAALQDAGIEIPFPHLQLHIDGASGLEESLKRVLGAGQAAE